MFKDLDDKNLVIICVTFLAFSAMLAPNITEPTQILGQAITGMFGVAIGKGMKNGNGQ